MQKENNDKTFACNNCENKSEICQLIPPLQIEKLYKYVQQLKFKKNEYIIKQGAKSTQIVYLSKGKVKLNYETDSGQNVILSITSSSNLLGGVNLQKENKNYFSIIAIEDCEICLLDLDILSDLEIETGKISYKLLEFLSEMFKESILNVISLAHKQVNGRIADVLLYLAKNVYKTTSFKLTLTRKEISEFAGCSEENVIHTFSRFHKENIINSKGKNMEILNMEMLQNISRIG